MSRSTYCAQTEKIAYSVAFILTGACYNAVVLMIQAAMSEGTKEDVVSASFAVNLIMTVYSNQRLMINFIATKMSYFDHHLEETERGVLYRWSTKLLAFFTGANAVFFWIPSLLLYWQDLYKPSAFLLNFSLASGVLNFLKLHNTLLSSQHDKKTVYALVSNIIWLALVAAYRVTLSQLGVGEGRWWLYGFAYHLCALPSLGISYVAYKKSVGSKYVKLGAAADEGVDSGSHSSADSSSPPPPPPPPELERGLSATSVESQTLTFRGFSWQVCWAYFRALVEPVSNLIFWFALYMRGKTTVNIYNPVNIFYVAQSLVYTNVATAMSFFMSRQLASSDMAVETKDEFYQSAKQQMLRLAYANYGVNTLFFILSCVLYQLVNKAVIPLYVSSSLSDHDAIVDASVVAGWGMLITEYLNSLRTVNNQLFGVVSENPKAAAISALWLLPFSLVAMIPFLSDADESGFLVFAMLIIFKGLPMLAAGIHELVDFCRNGQAYIRTHVEAHDGTAPLPPDADATLVP